MQIRTNYHHNSIDQLFKYSRELRCRRNYSDSSCGSESDCDDCFGKGTGTW